MNNTPCLHCLMLTILVVGFIVMMIGLSLIPDTPTKQTNGNTVEPPVDKTAVVVGSYGFRLAMGGMTVDLIIIAGYLYAIWKENRDVSTVAPVAATPHSFDGPETHVVKPLVSILKKVTIIDAKN